MAVHQQNQHVMYMQGIQYWETPPEGEPQKYWMSLPTALEPQECPVNGVQGAGINEESEKG